jgi:hypothetical protein
LQPFHEPIVNGFGWLADKTLFHLMGLDKRDES